MSLAHRQTIRERANELTTMQEEYKLDPEAVANGVLMLLVMRMASQEDWDEVLNYIRSERNAI